MENNDNNELLKNASFKAVPNPGHTNIDCDTTDSLYNNIIDSCIKGNNLSASDINTFSRISQRRDQLYDMLEGMAKDVIISSALEIYAKDATEMNSDGRIVWCDSPDDNIQKCVTYFLDTMNVDKNAYKWIYSLATYGDLYLRLYRQSDMNDDLFDDKERNKLDSISHKSLNEDIKIQAHSKNDKYSHYIEMEPNPAEMYDLTKFGKTYGYVKAELGANGAKTNNGMIDAFEDYTYNFKRKDILIYQPTEYVHASLDNGLNRYPETVNIFNNNYDDSDKYTYTVRRGQSILQNVYKTWRECSLLQISMMLNRITKSSIIRSVSIEVGDMPKNLAQAYIQNVKNMIEQKSAFNVGSSFEEYANPGPVENVIYMPTRNGVGQITTSQIGGDVDVKGISDIEYYQDLVFSGLRIPKQYLGILRDSAGFTGGQSLSLESSRYAKELKSLQNCLIQALTDAINLMLLDKGLDGYINRFTLKMVVPNTQEEVERKEAIQNVVNLTRDINDILSNDIESGASRLKIIKSLLSTAISNEDLWEVFNEEIEKLETKEKDNLEDENNSDDSDEDENPFDSQSSPNFSGFSDNEPLDVDLGGDNSETSDNDMGSEEGGETSLETEEPEEETLPTPADLNQDMTNY